MDDTIVFKSWRTLQTGILQFRVTSKTFKNLHSLQKKRREPVETVLGAEFSR